MVVVMLMRVTALCNDFDIRLVLVDDALDQFVNLLRCMRRFNRQGLLHQVDIRFRDLFECRDITLDFC